MVTMIVTKKLLQRYETATHHQDFRVLTECTIDPISCNMIYQGVLHYYYSLVFLSALFNETKIYFILSIVFLKIRREKTYVAIFSLFFEFGANFGHFRLVVSEICIESNQKGKFPSLFW